MKIVTDCAADMTAEELEELNVAQVPLFIKFPEGEIKATDITADEFYNRLEAMRPEIPTTARRWLLSRRGWPHWCLPA